MKYGEYILVFYLVAQNIRISIQLVTACENEHVSLPLESAGFHWGRNTKSAGLLITFPSLGHSSSTYRQGKETTESHVITESARSSLWGFSNRPTTWQPDQEKNLVINSSISPRFDEIIEGKLTLPYFTTEESTLEESFKLPFYSEKASDHSTAANGEGSMKACTASPIIANFKSTMFDVSDDYAASFKPSLYQVEEPPSTNISDSASSQYPTQSVPIVKGQDVTIENTVSLLTSPIIPLETSSEKYFERISSSEEPTHFDLFSQLSENSYEATLTPISFISQHANSRMTTNPTMELLKHPYFQVTEALNQSNLETLSTIMSLCKTANRSHSLKSETSTSKGQMALEVMIKLVVPANAQPSKSESDLNSCLSHENDAGGTLEVETVELKDSNATHPSSTLKNCESKDNSVLSTSNFTEGDDREVDLILMMHVKDSAGSHPNLTFNSKLVRIGAKHDNQPDKHTTYISPSQQVPESNNFPVFLKTSPLARLSSKWWNLSKSSPNTVTDTAEEIHHKYKCGGFLRSSTPAQQMNTSSSTTYSETLNKDVSKTWLERRKDRLPHWFFKPKEGSPHTTPTVSNQETANTGAALSVGYQSKIRPNDSLTNLLLRWLASSNARCLKNTSAANRSSIIGTFQATTKRAWRRKEVRGRYRELNIEFGPKDVFDPFPVDSWSSTTAKDLSIVARAGRLLKSTTAGAERAEGGSAVGCWAARLKEALGGVWRRKEGPPAYPPPAEELLIALLAALVANITQQQTTSYPCLHLTPDSLSFPCSK